MKMTLAEITIRFKLAEHDAELKRWLKVNGIKRFVSDNINNKDTMDKFMLIVNNYSEYIDYVEQVMLLV